LKSLDILAVYKSFFLLLLLLLTLTLTLSLTVTFMDDLLLSFYSKYKFSTLQLLVAALFYHASKYFFILHWTSIVHFVQRRMKLLQSITLALTLTLVL